jgi:hypothetical protein
MRATPRARENLGAGATKAWAPRRPARERAATVFMVLVVVVVEVVVCRVRVACVG